MLRRTCSSPSSPLCLAMHTVPCPNSGSRSWESWGLWGPSCPGQHLQDPLQGARASKIWGPVISSPSCSLTLAGWRHLTKRPLPASPPPCKPPVGSSGSSPTNRRASLHMCVSVCLHERVCIQVCVCVFLCGLCVSLLALTLLSRGLFPSKRGVPEVLRNGGVGVGEQRPGS